MNGKVAKYLRRINKDSKRDKQDFMSFTHIERGELSAEYKARGDYAKEIYTKAKKLAKQERIDEQISNS